MSCLLAAGHASAGSPFVEQAISRGVSYPVVLGVAQLGPGLGMFDLDADGDPDILVLGGQDGGVGLYENDGSGTFTDRTLDGLSPRMARHTDYSGVSAADYDGDGDLDVYLSRYGAPNVLYRNEGGWVFTDATAESGLGNAGHSLSTAWADCNADGLLDVYVSNRTSTFGDTTENAFYENRGDGTFVEKAKEARIDRPGDPTLVAAFFDADGDTAPDLYLGTDKGTSPLYSNHMFRNTGGVFANVTEETGTEANIHCMGIAIGDPDRDGNSDLFLTNIPLGHVMLTGNADGTFSDSSGASGTETFELGWGTVFFDADNDGLEDLYICHAGAPNAFYRNTGSFPMTEAAASMNIAAPGTSYCVSTADIDRDGDLDMLVDRIQDRVQLFINTASDNGNAWAKFDVIGLGRNTFGVGTVIGVRLAGEAVPQRREVRAGHHYKAQDPTTVHFGLGAASAIEEITVDWPNQGGRRVLSGYPANRRWTLYPPERLGDLDRDGDVDQADRVAVLDRHVRLYSRAPETMKPGVEMLDADGDADFDEHDVLLIGSPCAADMALPVGVLDLSDIQSFVAGFTAMDPRSDLNGDTLFDLTDLGLFVSAFTAGCP